MMQLKSKDVLLILIGPIREEFKEYYEEIKGYVSKNNLSGRIRFLGEKTNIEEYMIASDLAVFSSKLEGFPNVIAESMVSGLPIVALKLDGISNYISEKNGIIISDKEDNEKASLKKFAQAIDRIHKHPGMYDKKSIRDQGIKFFSAKNIDAQYAALYASLNNSR